MKYIYEILAHIFYDMCIKIKINTNGSQNTYNFLRHKYYTGNILVKYLNLYLFSNTVVPFD